MFEFSCKALVLAALVVIIHLIQHHFYNDIPLMHFLIYLALVLVLGSAISIANALLVRRKLAKEMNERIMLLDNSIKLLITGAHLDWTLTQDELKKLERSVIPNNKVWVVTIDLENDDPDGGDFFNIVKENLARGIEYKYFVPDNDDIEERRIRISLALKEFKHLIGWYKLNDPFIWGRKVAIYMRDQSQEFPYEAYLELGFPKNIRWARLDNNITRKIIVRLGKSPKIL